MGDVSFPIATVDRVWGGKLVHSDSMDPIQPARCLPGDVTENNVFAVSDRPTLSLQVVECGCDLKELGGVAAMGDQHASEHNGRFGVATDVAGIRAVGLGGSAKDAVDDVGVTLPGFEQHE